jgi:hypothetical protein
MLRRSLSLIFAVIMAFQLSWIAASNYCTHETGRAAAHFGHHQHVEDGNEFPVALKDKPTVLKKFAVHPHCASCHYSALAIYSYPPVLYVEPSTVAPSIPVIALSSVYTSPPERPQWNSAA